MTRKTGDNYDTQEITIAEEHQMNSSVLDLVILEQLRENIELELGLQQGVSPPIEKITQPKEQVQPPPKREPEGLVGLENLPWTAFREKRLCEPDESGWVFSEPYESNPLTDRLRSLLEREGEVQLDMGGTLFAVKFGKDPAFIQRITIDVKGR